MKLKKSFISLFLASSIPLILNFSIKAHGDHREKTLITQDFISTNTPKNILKLDNIKSKLSPSIVENVHLNVCFNKENELPNIFYLQILSRMIINPFIERLKETYGINLDRYMIKDFKSDGDIENPLFAFMAIEEKPSIPATIESIRKITNSLKWHFYIGKKLAEGLSVEEYKGIGKFFGTVTYKGLDNEFNEYFKQKIESEIDSGILTEILDKMVETYNKQKSGKNDDEFKKEHPEYPDDFIDKIQKIKNMPTKKQKDHIIEVFFGIGFKFRIMESA